MARRGFGSTALRAALGAATGVAEGLQQRELLAAQRKKEEDTMRQAQQMGMANLMLQGFEAPAVTMERQQGARQAAGSAIASALQAASGQAPTPIMGDFEALAGGYATARPDRTVTLGGQALTLRETPTERQERLGRTQTMMANQAFENAVAQLPAELQPIARASKTISPNVMQAVLQPRQDGMTEYQKEMIRLREAELRDRRQDRTATKAASAEAPSSRSEMQSGLQAMGVARANSALNLLETNARAMDKFEADLLANKSSINFVQLELARKALKGDAGSAAAEAALAKSGDSGRALLRYVRGGKAIAGAVREITPRGGSNLMMQMETALSGIGPAGADPESVDQVQVFRNDLLTGVREGVNAMRGTQRPQGSTPEAPSAKPQVVDQDYEAAKQAIAQGRDRAAVIARYESTGKKWPGGR